MLLIYNEREATRHFSLMEVVKNVFIKNYCLGTHMRDDVHVTLHSMRLRAHLFCVIQNELTYLTQTLLQKIPVKFKQAYLKKKLNSITYSTKKLLLFKNNFSCNFSCTGCVRKTFHWICCFLYFCYSSKHLYIKENSKTVSCCIFVMFVSLFDYCLLS